MTITSGYSVGELETARILLDKLGVSAEDLLHAPTGRRTVPTFAEYVPVVEAAVGDGARRTYGSYWNRITRAWPDRRLDEPTPSQIQQLAEQTETRTVPRRNARGGRGAAEHMVAAFRCLYKHAVADGLIREDANPARKVTKPRRLPSDRQALPDTGLAEINQTAASTGNDPALDCLLLRLHTETACRRGGALALRPIDLDPDQCLIRLREKGGTVRWQPVSATLMTHLQAHAAERGAPSTGVLLRYANGTPLTHRRYDHLWTRIGTHLPWVATQQVFGRRSSATGELLVAGRTTPLSDRAAAQLAAVLSPAGDEHPWPETIPGGFGRSDPVSYVRVRPELVVEIRVDPATIGPRWRHGSRYLRLRVDRVAEDLPYDLGIE